MRRAPEGGANDVETNQSTQIRTVRSSEEKTAAAPQVDEGGQWSQFLTGVCGPNPDMNLLMSRFAGIIVELEVTYAE